jgi:hypothetical protein
MASQRFAALASLHRHAVEHLGSRIAQKLAADRYGGESFLKSKNLSNGQRPASQIHGHPRLV